MEQFAAGRCQSWDLCSKLKPGRSCRMGGQRLEHVTTNVGRPQGTLRHITFIETDNRDGGLRCLFVVACH